MNTTAQKVRMMQAEAEIALRPHIERAKVYFKTVETAAMLHLQFYLYHCTMKHALGDDLV